jgi:hypothetical protein
VKSSQSGRGLRRAKAFPDCGMLLRPHEYSPNASQMHCFPSLLLIIVIGCADLNAHFFHWMAWESGVRIVRGLKSGSVNP